MSELPETWLVVLRDLVAFTDLQREYDLPELDDFASIQRHTRLPSAALSGALRALVRRRLVAKHPAGRAPLYSLTRAGEQIARRHTDL